MRLFLGLILCLFSALLLSDVAAMGVRPSSQKEEKIPAKKPVVAEVANETLQNSLAGATESAPVKKEQEQSAPLPSATKDLAPVSDKSGTSVETLDPGASAMTSLLSLAAEEGHVSGTGDVLGTSLSSLLESGANDLTASSGSFLKSMATLPSLPEAPGLSLPAMSIGGIEESLLPIGGMAQDSADSFPPFFGQDEGTQSPPSLPDQGQTLLGSWGAQSGGQNLELSFIPGGRCLLVVNGRRIEGSYAVRGNQLSLHFATGQSSTLTFSIEGSFLILSDGSRLERRRSASTEPPVPQMPETPLSAQSLEGAWVAGNGQVMIIMMFMKGVCGITVNGKQFFGPYSVEGNVLRVEFNNGKRLQVAFKISGNTLRFDDGTVLTRQNLPTVQGGQTQPISQPKVGPLEGVWAARTTDGSIIAFVFRGNQYFFLVNGQKTESGSFVLNGNRLEYTIMSGRSQGQSGANTWQLSGNVLIMTLPNGAQVQLVRQQEVQKR